MRRPLSLLCLLAGLALLGPVPAACQKDLDLSEHESLIRQMKQTLESDPSTVDSLADRISRSSLAGLISPEPNQERRLEAIKRWIAEHPEQAAQIAVGLARDDAEDNDTFETALKTSLNLSKSVFKENADLDKTIYGRLKKSSRGTRAAKTDEILKDEEKGELVKTLFEGDGSMTGKVLSFGGPPDAPPPAAPVPAGSGFYDNLSGVNMGGYSPQLLAIQSSLNNRRVPGAPLLIETGRLDYATLKHPSYQMRYDLKNLEARLRYERNFAHAKLLGKERSLTWDALLSEETGRKLEAEAWPKGAAGKAKLDARLSKRLKLLERVKALLTDFETAAAKAKDPSKITRGLLGALGSKQKEAARWITIASLEEELSMISTEEGFLSPEVLAAIAACPVSEDAKAAYKRRGEDYRNRLASLKANDAAAIAALESAGWEHAVAKVQSLLGENAVLRKNLSRNISDYTATPLRLAASRRVRPRWRQILDDLLLRFFPSSSYALSLKKDETQTARFRDVFLKIAAGDLDAAHAILGAGG
ncbi:MAG: hypothetical protein HZB91_00910 [Elusimicrobia bacterium]|nr:hypothetical protein [Elusimicrobiota bacterium]